MIPTINFEINELLMRCFFFERIYGPREKFEKDAQEVIDTIRSKEKIILSLIEKFSGLKWTHPVIPVYLIPTSEIIKYSFTKFDLGGPGVPGVVQKVGRGIHTDIPILIHELAHVNQRQGGLYKDYAHIVFNKDKTRNEDFLEVWADMIELYVVRELFGSDSQYEKELWNFLQNTNEKNKRKYEVLIEHMKIWDLNEHPLKFYLENLHA